MPKLRIPILAKRDLQIGHGELASRSRLKHVSHTLWPRRSGCVLGVVPGVAPSDFCMVSLISNGDRGDAIFSSERRQGTVPMKTHCDYQRLS